jgi:acyl-CoA thioester hydrolase
VTSRTPLRVRFAETDQMGIAHHSAYVVWCEAARVEWLRECGMSYREMEDEGLSLAVSEVRLSYRLSLRFDDAFVVETALTEARSRRFRFAYRVLKDTGEVAASGYSLHTPTSRDGRAVRLPERWLSALAPFVTPSGLEGE